MESNDREISPPRGSEDYTSANTPSSDLGVSSSKTIRDFEKEFQDLKRENFDLKLRIYFLEDQSQSTGQPNEYREATSYVQQLQNEIEQLRRRVESQGTPVRGSTATVYNFDYDDERRALRDELDKFRRENEFLRQSVLLNKNKSPHADERDKFLATTPPPVGQSMQTTTSASVDSGFDASTPGMSSTFRSNTALQLELNNLQERERKLQEQVNSLRRQLESSVPQTNETLVELDRARQQIRDYQAEIHSYVQQQSKAERVLQRLQADYEGRIAHIVGQQKQQLNDFETYRHERDQSSPGVNMDDYRHAIDDRDRVIQQLEETINEMTTRLRTPFTLILPGSAIDTRYTDEHSRNLIVELNQQMQTHLETIDQLRAECVELRRSEKHLRNQVDSLTHLINTPTRNPSLPPLPRPSPSSSKSGDAPEDTHKLQDLQMAVVQITLQLQTDAENVSGLTNRVAQIIRDRDEWQEKINRLQEELEKKNAQIRQLERREPEVESRIRQQFAMQIEMLQRELKEFQDQVRERDRRLKELDNEKEGVRVQLRKDYEKVDFSHNQEKQNLQGQLQAANEELQRLRRQFDDQREQYEDLQRKYGQARASTENHAELLERGIQQQKIQIEEFNLQMREIEASFQQERRRLEREREFEKEKNVELQNALNAANRQNAEFQTESDRFQSILNDQRYQFDRERDESRGEIEHLRRENQIAKDRGWEMESRLTELARKNDELKGELSTVQVRFQDNEDIHKRYRSEIAQLQRDSQDLSRQNNEQLDIAHEWERKYKALENRLDTVQYDKERSQTDNRTMEEENLKLKQEMEELTIQIRLQIEQEYQEEFRQLDARRDIEIHNIQKDQDATRGDFERLNNEKTRLADRLHVVEINLKQANETIDHYEKDITRLRQALSQSEEKSLQLEEEISRAFNEELKMKNDHLQDLDNKYRSAESQLAQYERTLLELREGNEHLRDDYDRYRVEQERRYGALQRTLEETERANSTTNEERVRREIVHVTENKQALITQLENQLRDKDNLIRKLQHDSSIPSQPPKDLQLELEIRIEQLEQEVEVKERYIRTYSETVQEKDQQIEKLLDDIQKGDHNNGSVLDTLREELHARERRLDQVLNEKNSTLNDRERHISELQVIIRDRERDLVQLNEKLRQIEEEFDIRQRQLDDSERKREISRVDLNIATEENEAHLDRIKLLEKQLQMSQTRNTTSEQIAHFQATIEDLKGKLRQREDSIQSLQRTVSDTDRELQLTRQNQNHLQADSNRAHVRYEQMDRQAKLDLDDREQLIASLRKKLADKEQEINKLRDNDIAKEAKISQLRSKSRESDQESRSEYSAARAPSNVSLRLEIQKKDDLIENLKSQLERALRDTSPSGRDPSSAIQYAERVDVRRRPLPKNYDNLNREELLYELEMALQDNEGLLQQLAKRSPNITELHNQLLDVRKELARQKYVNQVLWRKLDALMDIQGSNTRAELAIELANYHDELEALKARQHRATDARLAVINASSRSSSEFEVNSSSALSDPVLATITHLENSNRVCQERVARVTDQLNRCESKCRNYQRQRMKCEKRLADAGLIDSSSTQQRRHSMDDLDGKTTSLTSTVEPPTSIDYAKSVHELEEIIHNQKKYIQQLQLRIRITTSETRQSSASDKTAEHIKHLNLVIHNYKNESQTLKSELQRLCKTMEIERATLQQYEEVIKEQQNFIERAKNKSQRKEQSAKKYELIPTILSGLNGHLIESMDDLIIDLNIDIIPSSDQNRKTSLNKKDSGVESVMESTRLTLTQQEYQRQLNDRDEQIKHLTKQLNDLRKAHENEINQYRLKAEKAQTDLIDDLNGKQDDLRQARLQIDLLKSTRIQLEQAQDQNQRLHGEIKLLQQEVDDKKGLISHYEKQMSLLEKQIASSGKGEMSIRTSEMSELLDEMRRLRHDLERSINKQNELQLKLEENIRQSRTPREFTFSGRGVSYPDLRVIDATGTVGGENLSFTAGPDEKRSRPLGSSTTELEIETPHPIKGYVIGELENHETLRRLIADLKIELKAIEVKLKEKLRSKFTSALTDPSIEWLEHRLKSLTQCLARLEQTYQLIESYWKANLPLKNSYDEHPFADQRLNQENKELKISQSRYMQDLQTLRQKYKEQSIYMDQVLAQLTKANHKKANTDDYLALLLRPTLDVLQKARSNMENHLKESNLNQSSSSGSAQPSSRRRQRPNRLD